MPTSNRRKPSENPIFDSIFDQCCSHFYAQEISNHPYIWRCSLPSDHQDDHAWKPAFRLLYWLAYEIPIPSNCVVAPINENWLDIRMENLQALPWYRYKTLRNSTRDNREDRGWIEQEDGWYKRCKNCRKTLKIEEFNKDRNSCKICWKQRLNRNTKRRRAHIEKYGCYFVDPSTNEHIHLGHIGDPLPPNAKELVWRLWIKRSRTRSSGSGS